MKVTKDFDLEHLLNDFPEFYIWRITNG
jgi:hypothetical protein